MKKLLCFCFLLFICVLSSCGKQEDKNLTKMIDFSDYTINDVISWTLENDVAEKFTYVYDCSTDKQVDTVISQNVESGKPITDNIIITIASNTKLLESSDKNVVVPNVIGKQFEDAKEDLISRGLKFDFVYSSSDKAKDVVLLLNPLPGISVSKDVTVVLTLSSGKREFNLSIDLPINIKSCDEFIIKVYIDGELDRSKTVCLDSSITHKIFKLNGSGLKEVRFVINDEEVAIYNVDFDNGQVYKVS